MNKHLILGLAAVALMSTSAFAADLGVYAPAPAYSAPIEMAPAPVVSSTDWNGAYVGVLGGYGRGESEHSVPGTGTFLTDGWIVGGEAGYNFHLDNGVVAGISADLSWTDLDGATGTVSTDLDWLATARGRVGYAFDAFLPYVTGGFALADVNGTDTAAAYNADEVQLGLTIGAGAEVKVSDNISVKAEYLYVDLSGDHVFGPNSAQTVETRTHVVRAGIGFGF